MRLGEGAAAIAVPSMLRRYDASRPLFFLHIPKTGGTSLSASLSDWYPGRLLAHYRRDEPAPPRHRPGAGELVAGHFNRLRGFGVPQYYPQADQFITVLRHPFDRFVSQWLYLSSRTSPLLGQATLDAGFEAWLERRGEAFGRGEDDFSMLAQLPTASGGLDEGFVAVGLTEAMDDTLRVFAAALGRTPPAACAHVNRTGLGTGAHQASKARHRQLFEAEYELYEHARMLFEVGRRTYL